MDGSAAKFYICHAVHVTDIETLIAHRASDNSTAKFRLSALILVLAAGHAEIVHFLTKAGTLKAWMGTHFLSKQLKYVSTEMSLHVQVSILKNGYVSEPTSIKLNFKISNFNTGPLRFENKKHKDLIPYLEVDRYGTAVFVIYIVATEMIKDRTDYQQHISVSWAVNVSMDALPSIKKYKCASRVLLYAKYFYSQEDDATDGL